MRTDNELRNDSRNPNFAELVIAAEISHLSEVFGFVKDCLDRENCPRRVLLEILVAVEEIFVNIAHYAYNPKIGTAIIRCAVDHDPDTAVITFLDEGFPYNPLSRDDPDVTLTAEKRKIGGLGIYMVKKTMDDVEYEYRDGRNILVLKKRF